MKAKHSAVAWTVLAVGIWEIVILVLSYVVCTTVSYMSWLVRWFSLWLGRIQCSTNYVCGLAWVLFSVLYYTPSCCNILYLYSVYEGSGLVVVEFNISVDDSTRYLQPFPGTVLCG